MPIGKNSGPPFWLSGNILASHPRLVKEHLPHINNRGGSSEVLVARARGWEKTWFYMYEHIIWHELCLYGKEKGCGEATKMFWIMYSRRKSAEGAANFEKRFCPPPLWSSKNSGHPLWHTEKNSAPHKQTAPLPVRKCWLPKQTERKGSEGERGKNYSAILLMHFYKGWDTNWRYIYSVIPRY